MLRWCTKPLRPIAVFLLALPAGAENLLANPGFEDLNADIPARWDHFVQPQPGAVAEISDTAHSGEYAIWLHTPAPYETEPVNNWSQNIITDLGGETLEVSGYIRVDEAQEAAIWLQMWRKRPWGVLGAASTSKDMPVYGTEDWQKVSMTVDVPEGTDFVTLRCVLLGTGSAWFDDISVARAADSANEAEGSDKADQADKADSANEAKPSSEAVDTVAVPESEADTKKRQQEALIPLVDALESEVSRLREANVVLTDTLEEIQQVNQELLREMLSVQAELRRLKSEKESATAPPLDPARPRVPPLIPLSEAGEAEE